MQGNKDEIYELKILEKMKRGLFKIVVDFVIRTWLLNGEGLGSTVVASVFLVIATF